jgi:hypothetical protein
MPWNSIKCKKKEHSSEFLQMSVEKSQKNLVEFHRRSGEQNPGKIKTA